MALTVNITINTEGDNLTPLEKGIILALSGSDVAVEVAEATPVKATPAPAKKAAAPARQKPEPEPEPDPADEVEDEPEEDLMGEAEEDTSGYTVDQALDHARGLLDAGKVAEVKNALKEVGAKKVSDLKAGQVAAFMKALG